MVLPWRHRPFKDVKTGDESFRFSHRSRVAVFLSERAYPPDPLDFSPRSGLDVFLPHIDDTAALLSPNSRREWFFDFDCSKLVHVPNAKLIFLPRISRLPLFLVRQIVEDLISGMLLSFALTDSIAAAAVSFGFGISDVDVVKRRMSDQRAERQKSMKNRPWQDKRTENLENLGKVGDGMTKIKRSKT
jgi:hypothetical protein